MSHTTSIKAVKIQSVTALRAAIAAMAATGMKISLEENAKPRAYSTNQQGMGTADLVVRIPDAAYDIGLYKQADGSYEPRTDFWNGSVERLLGATPSTPERAAQAKLGKLFQAYGVEAAAEAARKKGLSVRRTTQQDGTIKLVLTGAAL